MNVKSAHIRYYHKSGMRVQDIDGNVSIKTLPYLSIVEAVEGSYDIALGTGKTYSTGAHGFFIAPAHVLQTITHRTDPKTGRMECRWIFLDLVLNEHYLPEELFALPTVLTGEDAAPLHELFDRLYSTQERLREYAIVYEILANVLSHAQEMEQPKGTALAKSLRYIRENYASPIRIAMLAALEHTSESNYHARFKREMGISPVAYINHFRLSLAAEALVNSKESVAAIGASVGIPDPLYFSKLFRRTYHTTPGQYRRRRG